MKNCIVLSNQTTRRILPNDKGVSGSFTPDKTAIPWLLLDKVGVEDGLTGGDILSKTTKVQR